MTTRPLGLYLHVPFCRQRCDFCAFYLEIHRDDRARLFLEALTREIPLAAKEHLEVARPVQSVYVGGGTPTVLAPEQLRALLDTIREGTVLSPDCEITVEAHPAGLSAKNLALLREGGVTRISFGAESMDDGELARIGRPGAVRDTVTAVASARQAGFSNINLDLMYGLPGQTIESWRRTVEGCLALAPEHLSCYALTVEDETKLAKQVLQHRTPAPDEGRQNDMEDLAHSLLKGAGYRRYEISNYAKPGFECRHNLLYWTGGEYLGLGPSAQSYMGGVRFGNVADLASYARSLADNRLPMEDRTPLSTEEQLRDAVIFGLRLLEGVPTDRLEEHSENYGIAATVAGLHAQRLIEEDGDRSRLTEEGRRFADSIAEQLY